MATVFDRGDLLYGGYKHTAHPDDDPRLTGRPDSTMLNRNESYEMAYFINRYMNQKGYLQISTGQKIERYLKEYGGSSRSHAEWRRILDNGAWA
ncbi:hypothetical protein GCM10023149_30960 [Mucilaginibacter gynuensis]|uniref:Uncharacterized protein n=1 Tax=Mucilaginibacter gynuensis TaxID=1302236 RepID=A0ABP8GNH8_9SPHI